MYDIYEKLRSNSLVLLIKKTEYAALTPYSMIYIRIALKFNKIDQSVFWGPSKMLKQHYQNFMLLNKSQKSCSVLKVT